ncbi:hypothetical protein [Cellulomonas cellasea]|uniref:hypothetical protein n=1 Tax=Cellulomonas cellasea TaxID=43670 RepID=UPI0025A369B4|nr:hypothetical protein [Cellulomonas cellasea]
MNKYKLLIVSAVGDRDGMALELADVESGEQVAEVFVDARTQLRTVAFYTNRHVPFEVVEWLLSEATKRL